MGENGAAAPDPIDAAIAAADQEVVLRQIPVTIGSTGRHAVIAVPPDATDSELAELAGWMLTSVMQSFRAERAAKAGPQLVVARGALPPVPLVGRRS